MSLREHWRKRYSAAHTLGWTTKVWLRHQKNAVRNLETLFVDGTIPDGLVTNCLEIGSGSAAISRQLKYNFPELNVVLSDFLPEVVDELTNQCKQFEGRLTAIEVDAYTVNEEFLTTFDLIYSFGDVSAVGHKEAFDNVAKNMRIGGYLVCDFINHLSPIYIFKPMQVLRALFRYYRYKKNGTGKIVNFGKYGIMKLCKKHNLKVLKLYPARYHFGLRGPIILVAQKIEHSAKTA